MFCSSDSPVIKVFSESASASVCCGTDNGVWPEYRPYPANEMNCAASPIKMPRPALSVSPILSRAVSRSVSNCASCLNCESTLPVGQIALANPGLEAVASVNACAVFFRPVWAPLERTPAVVDITVAATPSRTAGSYTMYEPM